MSDNVTLLLLNDELVKGFHLVLVYALLIDFVVTTDDEEIRSIGDSVRRIYLICTNGSNAIL